MTLIDAALSRSRMVLSILIFLFIAGGFAYVSIPKEADPDVNIPILYSVVTLEGISPEDAERLLVRPLEKEMKSVEGLKEMTSSAFDGGGSVVLEFEAGYDIDQALDDTREKVDLAKINLPDDAEEPSINEVNLSLFPVLVVSVFGDVPERVLLSSAERLQDVIEELPNVLEAPISGKRDEVVEVIIDPAKLERYNLQPFDLINLLSAENQLVAAGVMDTGNGRFSIKVPGLFETAKDIMDMPLFTGGEGVVHFRDVATVNRTFKDRKTFARFNGEAALAIEVSKRVGTNIVETIEQVRQVVEAETAKWPESIQVKYSQDKSKQIRIMLTDLQNNVIAAVLLVLIVIVGILGVRSGLLVGVAIPGSFLTSILLLSLMGLTVNIVVLFSLILSVGILVDGAIVVSEYADRKISEGLSKPHAYSAAAKRMALPIIASTATTLAAFMPLLFWPGLVGEFMKFMPITLITTLLASLFMALIFMPTLGANIVTVGQFTVALIAILLIEAIFTGGAALIGLPDQVKGLLFFIAIPVGLYIAWRLRHRVALLLDSRMESRAGDINKVNHQSNHNDDVLKKELLEIKGLTGLYLGLLKKFLKITPLVLLAAVLLLIGSWVAYFNFGKGVEFFPDVEPEQLLVNIHARGNYSVFEQDRLVREVENIILDLQDTQTPFKSVYVSSGLIDKNNDDAEDIIGRIQLELEDWNKRPSADEIISLLRQETKRLAGVQIEVRIPEAGPPRGKPIHIEFSSNQPDLLLPLLEKTRTKLNEMEGLVDIEDSRSIPGIEWEIQVNREQAAKFNVNIATLGAFVQLVTRGVKIDSYRPDYSDEEIDIILRFPEAYRNLDQLDSIRVLTPNGPVPVGNFIERKAFNKTGKIDRVDGKRIMLARANVEPNYFPSEKVEELRQWIESIDIPQGVDYVFRGDNEEEEKAQAFLSKAFGVALFLIAVILVAQFNRFYATFLILTAVIMSTVGVFLGLLVTGQAFGIVMSGIGVIALAGIVVNNNIILIDTFDQLKKEHEDIETAILLTAAQRMRPVLLTTCTTILGLMPMVLQLNIDFFTREVTYGAPSTQWWVQLSTAIVFGLSFSTILTLIVTPCLLKLPQDLRHLLKRFSKNKKHASKALT